MKKRNSQKKLTLNRETIKNLEDTSLELIYGGGLTDPTFSCWSCPRVSCTYCPDEN